MINTAGGSGAAATKQAVEENKEEAGEKDENDYEQEAHNYLSLAL